MENKSELKIAKRSARGSLLLFAANFLSTATLAISTIIVARLLGPGMYGVYTLVLIIPSLFQLVLGFGVNSAITRFAAYHLSLGEDEQAMRYTINGMVFIALFAVCLSAVSFITAQYLGAVVLHRTGLSVLIQYASSVILLDGLLQASIAALMGWSAMGLAGASSVVQAFAKVLIAPLLVLLGFGVYGALFGHILSVAVAAGFASFVLYFMRIRKPVTTSLFLGDVREMLSYSLPLYAGSVVSGFASQYLTIILAAVAANAVVGFYSAAYNITTAISLVSSAITLALFPAFASLDGARADVGLAFKYAVKYLAFAVAPIVMFLIGTAGYIVQLLYGQSYSPSGEYLVLLCVANLPLIIGFSVVTTFFSGIGRTRLSFLVYAVGASVVFVCAPLFGIVLGLGVGGLIYALILANLISASLGLSLASRHMGAVIEFKPIISTLAASLIAYAAILGVSLFNLPGLATFILDLCAFALVYLTVAPLLQAISPADLIRLTVAFEGLGVLTSMIKLVISYERKVLRS